MSSIQLAHTYATLIDLKRLDVIEKEPQKTFNLSFKPTTEESKKCEFKITFHLDLTDGDSFELKTEYVALFNADSDIDEDFQNSDFIKINAPAIAYPYLRSFITLLMMNSGYSNVYLPTINFVEMDKEKEKNNKM
ncbi:Protein-export protein SecB [bioreactor metagenome]|uniref:Protein-export protein SecB n=1 Tax=bioreactor metagenome TaxID=1076179 RepID=A0A645BGC8_9ZZZZ